MDRCWPDRNTESCLLSRSLILRTIFSKLECDASEPNVAEDVARLVHLLLLAVLFILNNNSAVCFKSIKFVEDFNKIRRYDWCGYILEGILTPMRRTTTLKIAGCAVFLLVWNSTRFIHAVFILFL